MGRRSIVSAILMFFGILSFLNASSGSSLPPNAVSFPGAGGAQLYGFLYKPEGPGPFPALLYNHGSGPEPKTLIELAKFYTDHGIVFFYPHRRGHGLSRDAGFSVSDQTKALADDGLSKKVLAQKVVALHEKANEDVVAAALWLKGQPFVDPARVSISGVSYGGIQTVLTGEMNAKKDLGLKCFVPFAPGAMSWNPVLGKKLESAIAHTRAPVFLIQAQNDYSLKPSQFLGPVVDQKGLPNRHKVYPPFGDSPQAGHGYFAVKKEGTDVWGADVLQFLKDCGGL